MIFASDLSKDYGSGSYALQNLNLSLPCGSVFGFLGPNGAGKTTTVKLMAGLIRPSGGYCLVADMDPSREPEKVHAVCGFMTETAHLYNTLTGRQNLQFFGEASGMTEQEANRRADELLRQFDLWEAREKQVAQYSTGMTQRLSLARALVHHPQVLFLDEPTSGLDPESSQLVNAYIQKLAEQEGTTVFLCTHQLRYAQDLCTSYGILEKGKLLACGDLPMLSRIAGCRIQAQFRLRTEDVLSGFTEKDGWQVCNVLNEEEMPVLLRRILEQGHDIYEAKLIHPSLEDVYFALLKEKQEVSI